MSGAPVVAELAVVRVVAGAPTYEELAALVAVFAAAGGGGEPARPPVREWASPARAVRAPMRAGRGAWSHSAWPQ